MRKVGAILLVSVLIVGLAAPGAHAGGGTATNVALGLASFAVFNQLFGPALYLRPAYAAPVYMTAPPYQVIYAAPPTVFVQPSPPPAPRVVYYPHGRYELRGDGITAAYQWVWIPNPPPPPAAGYEQPSTPSPLAAAPSAPGPSAAEPCKPTGKYVKTPQGLLPECE
jgi:hypothetical protein